MVCYVGTWAIYRPGDGKFELDQDIDPFLCTHIMYGFTKLQDNKITVFDPWGDLKDEWGSGRDGYNKFTSHKKVNPDLKAIVAIGGWNEGSTKYSDMARDPSARKTFVDSVVPFLEKYNFDGLDLDWVGQILDLEKHISFLDGNGLLMIVLIFRNTQRNVVDVLRTEKISAN